MSKFSMNFSFATALLNKFGRRYSAALQDAGQFVDQINIVRRAVPEWRRRALDLDRNQVEAIATAVDELRKELRALSVEMTVGEGHLHEATATGETLVNRLATGAHLAQEENLAYLLAGDVDGLALYLGHTERSTVDRALAKVSPEQKAIILEALLAEGNR